MKGKVISGFGRGSKELGIPTANLPVEGAAWIDRVDSGVYFGWAGIQLPAAHAEHPATRPASPTPDLAHRVVPATKRDAGWRLFPFVMSIGYNPFYKNTVRSAEVHIIDKFTEDFYGAEMAISLLGFIRPEYDYVSVQSLIADINEDIEVAKRSLDREKWKAALDDGYLWGEEVVIDF